MARNKTTSRSKRHLIAKKDPKSPITEQYRTIRTNIQYASVDQAIRSIVVTSTGPMEGKSTTTANLAVVFAQQGKKTLLIDADLRKPTAHYTFQLPNTFGLTSVLTKQAELMDAVHMTDVENLFVLTSGPIPPNPAELLASVSMEYLLKEAYNLYDFILFDTPPVLTVTDAQVLANLADGSILVTSSGTTDRDGAIKAKEILTSAQAKLLGAVLNNKKADKDTHYYYYYAEH
ncbi:MULTISPECIES: CpsD/CapB family tyrosine-protein kinase [Bacillaceae]|jgi:protein-tyrosine kinase|uniref:CpsD/CapB family tyrosine-protein kinase n=1 Tax=Bacillaceae TaxID=186817 RepID=UPI0005A499BD|nr:MULTISPECIES: CpsD/CapB family tyrosine-protein kinase [Bacillaceae]KIO64077.1 Tyrosine-protein kinase EpsD [Caldibacillus thermoamylovorans]MBU5343523.1 CpsD/CapB family tyrosine-protein kinase [Caldifermentibacillus hisashii]MCM3054290.1 CpsD/CapB family tyrosine-protein kinase [Caldibacillus thermoamylovorans]MEC5271989.1 CpsD/CapB family tyrosine-protein kinase [Caldifermentibacillus hisashii]PAC34372.1 capsular biosynthesis protein [Caldifermentibacillus hisashii]